MKSRKLSHLDKIITLISLEIKELSIAKVEVKTLTTAYFISIFENIHACSLLYKNRSYSPVPVIIRSTIEAAIDMHLLINTPEYINVIQKRNAEQIKKIVTSYQSTNQLSPKQQDIASTTLTKTQEILSQSTSTKKSGLYYFACAQDVFEDEETELYTMYRLYCRETHNNLGALIGRHVDNNEISLFKSPDQNSYDFHITNLAFLLVASASIFFQHIAHKSLRLEEALKVYKTHLQTSNRV